MSSVVKGGNGRTSRDGGLPSTWCTQDNTGPQPAGHACVRLRCQVSRDADLLKEVRRTDSVRERAIGPKGRVTLPDAVAQFTPVGQAQGAVTVKPPVSVELSPLVFVTVTLRAFVGALAAMVKVAVIWVDEATATFDAVTPLPFTLTDAPAANPVPVIVTGTTAPCAPRFGATEVTVTGAVMVKVRVPDVPPPGAGLTTVTEAEPAVDRKSVV